MCRHVGRQMYEIEKTHSTHTQASTSIKNIYSKILYKKKHTQHIKDKTAGPDMYQIIWAYPPTAVPTIWKFNA
jgi:hypothetical protein